ncbi:MAG: hypothetical protein H6883_12595 [Rhodobiaceae bacterium]|nr:hypothetical protein [Rhodobiaceae bacterium]MCC0056963.1 hypothetical protein [Rhodobiaceae bacterium]
MTFDPATIVWYGAICGLLSLAAPRIGGHAARLAIGIVVGIVAATAFPLLRARMGL